MMKLLWVALSVLLVYTASYAQQIEHIYLGAEGGYDVMELGEFKYDNVGLSANIGLAISSSVDNISPRYELAFTKTLISREPLYRVDYSYMAVMVNAYLDIELLDVLIFYPTVGAGVRMHQLEEMEQERTMTYQLGAGFRLMNVLLPNTALDVTARYVDSDEAEFENSYVATITGWNITAGLEYWF
jgi:opacity protein-like surface antigen